MIELRKDRLVFSFPEIHRDAVLEIEFQRTLRIPDDGNHHFLPPGLGRFPVRHVDDFAEKAPGRWLEHGGVMLPMYQSEALWLNFGSRGYPFAVKIAAGKIDAVTGKPWTNEFGRKPQNYVVTPGQPWLDGFCVGNGVIRQFVAMPLGSGYSAEEQITGEGEHGGIQIMACPIKSEVWESMEKARVQVFRYASIAGPKSRAIDETASMGLAPGGKMKQQIFDDTHALCDWSFESSSRCFVHLANSMVWRTITGDDPPTVPPTAREYTEAGLPWFDYYADGVKTVGGSGILARLKSVIQLGKEKGDVPLPENEPVKPKSVVPLRNGLRPGQVREWRV